MRITTLSFALLFLFMSCANDDTCAVGTEGCTCTLWGHCDPGLTCKNDQCIVSEGTGDTVQSSNGETDTSPVATSDTGSAVASDKDTESNSEAEICSDGLDNDNDGAVDCQDAECLSSPDCVTASDTVNASTDQAFRIFLLLGQSNMVGYPRALEEDNAEDERIQVLGYDNCSSTGRIKDEWDVASPPLHQCGGGLGPGDYFAKTLIDALPEGNTVGLVPCAINGQPIEDFMKKVNGGAGYDRIIERAKIAQQSGGEIQGILFHQGESNNTDTAWPGNVNTVVEDIKADLDLGDIPFLAGELLYTGSCAPHNLQIAKLPEVVTNAHVISAEGLVVDPSDTDWELHFDRDSQVELGKRYAAKMIEALGLSH